MHRLLAFLMACSLPLASADAALRGHWMAPSWTAAANTTIPAAVGTNGVLTDGTNTDAVDVTGPGTLPLLALRFDGDTAFIEATSGNGGVSRNKAIIFYAMWVKVANGEGGKYFIYQSQGGDDGSLRCTLSMDGSGHLAVNALVDGEGVQTKTTSSSYDDGTWHHVAAMVNYPGDAITIYVDGSAVTSTGTIAFTGTASSNTDTLSLRFAARRYGSDRFKGDMCDVRIYDSDESGNLATIIAGANAPSGSAVAKILLQLSDARLRRQSKHFATYGVYSLSP